MASRVDARSATVVAPARSPPLDAMMNTSVIESTWTSDRRARTRPGTTSPPTTSLKRPMGAHGTPRRLSDVVHLSNPFRRDTIRVTFEYTPSSRRPLRIVQVSDEHPRLITIDESRGKSDCPACSLLQATAPPMFGGIKRSNSARHVRRPARYALGGTFPPAATYLTAGGVRRSR